jgi:hypothetical protein
VPANPVITLNGSSGVGTSITPTFPDGMGTPQQN